MLTAIPTGPVRAAAVRAGANPVGTANVRHFPDTVLAVERPAVLRRAGLNPTIEEMAGHAAVPWQRRRAASRSATPTNMRSSKLATKEASGDCACPFRR